MGSAGELRDNPILRSRLHFCHAPKAPENWGLGGPSLYPKGSALGLDHLGSTHTTHHAPMLPTRHIHHTHTHSDTPLSTSGLQQGSRIMRGPAGWGAGQGGSFLTFGFLYHPRHSIAYFHKRCSGKRPVFAPCVCPGRSQDSGLKAAAVLPAQGKLPPAVSRLFPWGL